MSTELLNELDDPELLEADHQAVRAALLNQTRLDPVVAARVRARSERATEETRQRLGLLDVVVPTLRELRDET